MTVRLFMFGKGEKSSYFSFIDQFLHKNLVKPCNMTLPSDSLYDTFHAISDVMFFCQILAAVEVLNAAFGVVRTGVAPTLIQVVYEFEFHDVHQHLLSTI